MEEGTCSSCGAKILFVTDQDGTRLPVNKRRVRVYCSGFDSKWRFLQDPEDRPLLYHISHFVTCPDASSHSKTKEPKT